MIYLDGYTEYDKVHIAQEYLVPRQVRVNGLLPEEVTFSEESLRLIIRDYTREAGVRELEREIGKACRKIATQVAEGAMTGTVVVGPEQVREYLGKPRYRFEAALRTERPGVATGLAWTPTGGEVIFVESASMPGSDGTLILTGKLGEVMKESAQAARQVGTGFLGGEQALVVFLRKFRVDRQPHRGLAVTRTRQLHRELDALVRVGQHRDVFGVLV